MKEGKSKSFMFSEKGRLWEGENGERRGGEEEEEERRRRSDDKGRLKERVLNSLVGKVDAVCHDTSSPQKTVSIVYVRV